MQKAEWHCGKAWLAKLVRGMVCRMTCGMACGMVCGMGCGMTLRDDIAVWQCGMTSGTTCGMACGMGCGMKKLKKHRFFRAIFQTQPNTQAIKTCWSCRTSSNNKTQPISPLLLQPPFEPLSPGLWVPLGGNNSSYLWFLKLLYLTPLFCRNAKGSLALAINKNNKRTSVWLFNFNFFATYFLRIWTVACEDNLRYFLLSG